MFILLAALASAAGCGLSEYGKLMEAEQKRLQKLDEQAKLLDKPAELPVKGTEVFLLLPKGILPRAELFGDLLYRFTRDPYPRYSSSGGPDNQVAPIQEVYVGAAPGGKLDEFVQKALQPFGTTGGKPGKKVVNPLGRAAMQFDWINFEDANTPPSDYQSFFATLPGAQPVQVAVIFRMPKDQSQKQSQKQLIDKAIEACLQTLAVGPDAEQERQRHTQAKPKK
jgi:hypothetical protein